MNISKRYGSLLLLTFSSLLAFSSMSFGETTRVSVSSDGTEGDRLTQHAAISEDGRYVAFASNATNFVDGEVTTFTNVYIRDTTLGTTSRISNNTLGENANASSAGPAISANGHYVAFYSYASDLVENDTNDTGDVFLYSVTTNTITRVSVGLNGTESNGPSLFEIDVSADGRYVVFESNATNLVAGDDNNHQDVFLYDTDTGMTTLISTPMVVLLAGANDDSYNPRLSADGRYIVFDSNATNLVAGDTNNTRDIFIRDMVTQSTSLVSVALTGGLANSASSFPDLSADGRYITFLSLSSNLVAGDTNNTADIFIRDMSTGTTIRIVPPAGVAGTVEPNGESRRASISANGRHVSFHSAASNFVVGDDNDERDVFVYDAATSRTVRISVDTLGAQANGLSWLSRISDDGLKIAFKSDASNLVTGDTNGVSDVFMRSITHAIVPGDCDGDGDIDINDVICTINIVLSDGEAVNGADCDESGGDVDINDVICTINKVLGS